LSYGRKISSYQSISGKRVAGFEVGMVFVEEKRRFLAKGVDLR
jgi:hypothetical protein